MHWRLIGNPKMVWVGRVISWLLSANFLFSAYMKLSAPPMVLEGLSKMGMEAKLLTPIGILEAVCTILYLIPKTSVLGAVLLTGYMGGAIMTHLRVGDFFHLQIIIGVLVWLALWVRNPRLQHVLPFNCPHS